MLFDNFPLPCHGDFSLLDYGELCEFHGCYRCYACKWQENPENLTLVRASGSWGCVSQNMRENGLVLREKPWL